LNQVFNLTPAASFTIINVIGKSNVAFISLKTMWQ
jgi:hypothetical protein